MYIVLPYLPNGSWTDKIVIRSALLLACGRLSFLNAQAQSSLTLQYQNVYKTQLIEYLTAQRHLHLNVSSFVTSI